jgi:hypothetical protein
MTLYSSLISFLVSVCSSSDGRLYKTPGAYHSLAQKGRRRPFFSVSLAWKSRRRVQKRIEDKRNRIEKNRRQQERNIRKKRRIKINKKKGTAMKTGGGGRGRENAEIAAPVSNWIESWSSFVPSVLNERRGELSNVGRANLVNNHDDRNSIPRRRNKKK